MSQTSGPPTPVGEQLQERRVQLDLTQGALAAQVGVTVTAISSAENGRSMISRSKRPLWERALQLTPGTISRAYKEGSRIEPVDGPVEPLYADLSDPQEAAVWATDLPESDRRQIIDAVRAQRDRQRQGRA